VTSTTRVEGARGLRLAAASAGLAMMLAASAARADDYVVYSPYVTKGQSELELRGYQQRDGNPSLGGERAYEIAVGHAFTDWWRPEVYLGEYERPPGEGQQRVGNEFENVFQLTAQGEYWADFGFLLSYERNVQPDVPNAVEFGPLVAKQSGRFNQRLNLIWEKQVGGGADTKYEFRSAYRLTYKVTSAIAPGIEVYLRPSDSSSQIGPVLTGELRSAQGGELEYRVGVVLGVNRAAPDQTFLAQLEYEFF
jgi:hypothetical protein